MHGQQNIYINYQRGAESVLKSW